MFVQRLSDVQVLTDIPIKDASETVWQAFSKFGLADVVIDAQRRKVTGSTGFSLSSYGKVFAARFEWHPNGLLITLSGDEFVTSFVNSGRGKKQLAELNNIVFSHLNRVAQNLNNDTGAVEIVPAVVPVSAVPASPISSPYGMPQKPLAQSATGKPVYGVAAVPKRGVGVLIYGILGLFLCCHLPAIFALIEGSKALNEYKTQDPGDKVMVYIGMGLGVIGCCLMALRPVLRAIGGG